ncbi:MAG: hypothetical protein INR70_06630 [Parafilimonas terrae]|nr:hypothetical protein [Parafilimonas terrae]
MIEQALPLLVPAAVIAVAVAYATRGKPPTLPPRVAVGPATAIDPAFGVLDIFHGIERGELAARIQTRTQSLQRANLADVTGSGPAEEPAPKPRAARKPKAATTPPAPAKKR